MAESATKGKKHVGIVIVGHVDAGKSTTTGRLLFELGGINQRDLDKLKKEAQELGKESFMFAFFMDKSKDERARGVTIACTTKEFFTDNFHYTIIDAPGHRFNLSPPLSVSACPSTTENVFVFLRKSANLGNFFLFSLTVTLAVVCCVNSDFIKNMISGASQADVALLMVPANKGGFETSIAKGNHKKGQVQGQTRQHARLCHLLGIEQLIVGINKMDAPSVNYAKGRFDEIKAEVDKMLTKIGYKTKKIPFIPLSGFKGDNLIEKSPNMVCQLCPPLSPSIAPFVFVGLVERFLRQGEEGKD